MTAYGAVIAAIGYDAGQRLVKCDAGKIAVSRLKFLEGISPSPANPRFPAKARQGQPNADALQKVALES